MNLKEPQYNLLMSKQDSDFIEKGIADSNQELFYHEKNLCSNNNFNQSHENIELTNILNSFTMQSSPKTRIRYDSQMKDGPPPIINILAENYRIKLTEKLSNCNAHQNELNLQICQNPIIPILYMTPHVPQNKRHVHFIPDKYDTIPVNAIVFDFNAAMIEHNEKITERQELAIAYAEMLCSDITSVVTPSRISPCFKFSSQRSAAKIAFDRTPQPKNSRPTLPMKQNSKKKIKIYQMKDQNDKSIFSDCCKESFYSQNGYNGQNSCLNDALSISKVNVPGVKTIQFTNRYQQQKQKKHNSRKNPSLSKPQFYRNSNGNNNKINVSGYLEKESSCIRTKRSRGPLQVISPNLVDGSFSNSTSFENQNKSYNMFKDSLC